MGSRTWRLRCSVFDGRTIVSDVAIPTVTVDDVPSDDVRTGPILLDVREPSEWVHGHIAGSLNIPLGELAERIDEIDRTRTVFVICRSGNRSALATRLLRSIGVEAYNVRGGVTAWADAGRTLESSWGRPGVVA